MTFLVNLLKIALGIVILGISVSICYLIVSATIYAVKKAIMEADDESKSL